MPTRLDTLGDHRIHAGVRRRLRLLDRADLEEDPHLVAVRRLHERPGIAPEQDDGGHPLRDRRPHQLPNLCLVLLRAVRVFQCSDDEVDPERPRGQLPGPLHGLWKLLGGKAIAAQHAEATRVRDPEPACGAAS